MPCVQADRKQRRAVDLRFEHGAYKVEQNAVEGERRPLNAECLNAALQSGSVGLQVAKEDDVIFSVDEHQTTDESVVDER